MLGRLLAVQQLLEIREWRMGRNTAAAASVARITGRFQLPPVLVVMAVQAQQFPVAAIRRIVVVIVVAVMDRQLAQVGAREFARATTADPRIDLERLLSVALLALGSSAAGVGHYAVESGRVPRFHPESPSLSGALGV